MLAVGSSLEDAQDLCDLDIFKGRLSVAASNSSASVTLSGDADAITQAQAIFSEEQKFCRLLKVDRAYHSHHMIPCRTPYIQKLKALKLAGRRASSNATSLWISTVTGERMDQPTIADLGTYWADNMVKPVLFSQALDSAINTQSPFDAVVEIGPHAAMQRAIKDNTTGQDVKHDTSMRRNVSALSSLQELAGRSHGLKESVTKR